MADIIRELEDLGREISNAERDVQTEEGKIVVYMETLKNDYGLNSIEEAEAKLKDLTVEKEGLDKEIDEKFTALKEGYTWQCMIHTGKTYKITRSTKSGFIIGKVFLITKKAIHVTVLDTTAPGIHKGDNVRISLMSTKFKPIEVEK